MYISPRQYRTQHVCGTSQLNSNSFHKKISFFQVSRVVFLLYNRINEKALLEIGSCPAF